jgi:membrane-associated protease RseP (regulator of RpoE activity)
LTDETPSTAPTSTADAASNPPRQRWFLPAGLFVATAASVYQVGQEFWGNGWQLAAPLLAILVAHELGHYLAARAHGERPSLPHFLPFPWGNPFGTLGAVLFLDDRQRSPRALLDIGAAGPLAGLTVALPMLGLGLSLSAVEPMRAAGFAQEGQSIVYWLAKRIVLGPIPPGYDVTMHPVLGAAWAGLYITFLNLLPVGQLDGGHVAYALLGERQQLVQRWLMFVPTAMAIFNLLTFGAPLAIPGEGGNAVGIWTLVSAVLPWVMLQALLMLMRWLGGFDHPRALAGASLGRGRRAVAWVTLACFVLLFRPSPWVVH